MSSNAWEVTPEDVANVIAQHGVVECVEIKPAGIPAEAERIFDDNLDSSDFDRIKEAVLAYTDFGDQVNAAVSELEDILMECELLSGEKKFEAP
jgi:hypothetical protein